MVVVVVVGMGMPCAATVMSAHVLCVWKLSCEHKDWEGNKEWTIGIYATMQEIKLSKVPWEEAVYIPFHSLLDCIGWIWVIIMSRTNESDACVREEGLVNNGRGMVYVLRVACGVWCGYLVIHGRKLGRFRGLGGVSHDGWRWRRNGTGLGGIGNKGGRTWVGQR